MAAGLPHGVSVAAELVVVLLIRTPSTAKF